jgi:hypothetical protein
MAHTDKRSIELSTPKPDPPQPEQDIEEFKRENKYLVIKWADLRKYLTQDVFVKFDIITYICDVVNEGRHKEGKKDNTYVVVNEDEPYAEDVWMLIEKGKSLKSLEREAVNRVFEGIEGKMVLERCDPDVMPYFPDYYRISVDEWQALKSSLGEQDKGG